MGNENPERTLNMLKLAESWYEIAGGNSKSKIGSSGKATTIYWVHCDVVLDNTHKESSVLNKLKVNSHVAQW